MSGLEEIFLTLITEFGFIGVFLISFIGTASILIPIPYTLVIFWMAARSGMTPIVIIISAAAGSSLGETVGYLIGYSAKSVVGQKRQKKLNSMLKVLLKHKNIWPLIVFLFALTPLPDDLLFIPLGLARFNFLRIFIPCLIGKTVMLTILVYLGKYINFVVGSFVGENNFLMGILFTIITIILLIATIFVIWKIDWEKFLNKYTPKIASEH